MKWHYLLYAALWLHSFVFLNGQVQTKPESILIHATMQAEGGISLEMTISSKEQKYVRAAIHTPTKTAGATIVYNGKIIQIAEEIDFQTSTRVLRGEEAASNLFDLIALNPDYHFKARDGFNLKTSVFDGYRVALQIEETAVAGTEKIRPQKAFLYKVDDAGDTLVRSIEYLSFFENIEPYLQPKEIVFTDESTGDTGRITVKKVEYNVGLPDFLFELDDDNMGSPVHAGRHKRNAIAYN